VSYPCPPASESLPKSLCPIARPPVFSPARMVTRQKFRVGTGVGAHDGATAAFT
jgi:hypothetical protein